MTGTREIVRRATMLALSSLFAVSTVAAAQSGQETTSSRPRGGRGAIAGRQRGGPPPEGVRPRQQALAREIRAAFAGVVRRELNLNDEQARRLAQVDARMQQQRNEIGKDERAARIALRTALEDTTATPDQAKVEELMGRMLKAQRRRIDLLESEQKELSAFLTPVQRAKYIALREQLARRVAQLRENGPPGPGGRRGGPPAQR